MLTCPEIVSTSNSAMHRYNRKVRKHGNGDGPLHTFQRHSFVTRTTVYQRLSMRHLINCAVTTPTPRHLIKLPRTSFMPTFRQSQHHFSTHQRHYS